MTDHRHRPDGSRARFWSTLEWGHLEGAREPRCEDTVDADTWDPECVSYVERLNVAPRRDDNPDMPGRDPTSNLARTATDAPLDDSGGRLVAWLPLSLVVVAIVGIAGVTFRLPNTDPEVVALTAFVGGLLVGIGISAGFLMCPWPRFFNRKVRLRNEGLFWRPPTS